MLIYSSRVIFENEFLIINKNLIFLDYPKKSEYWLFERQVMEIAMDFYIDLLRFVQMEFYCRKNLENRTNAWLLDLSEAWISYQNLNKNNLAFV